MEVEDFEVDRISSVKDKNEVTLEKKEMISDSFDNQTLYGYKIFTDEHEHIALMNMGKYLLEILSNIDEKEREKNGK